jgi:hypothetical protein
MTCHKDPSPSHSISVVKVVFRGHRKKKKADRRRHKIGQLTINEIGTIFRSADGKPSYERDCRVHSRDRTAVDNGDYIAHMWFPRHKLCAVILFRRSRLAI